MSKGATGTGADGRVICINRPVCVLGSKMPVHLPLPSALVSRAHALLVNDGDGVYVRDLASRNRLYVNGRPVREAELGDADVVRLGPFTFLCRSGFRAAGAKGRRAEAASPRPANRKAATITGFLTMAGTGEGEADPVPLSARTTLIGRRKGCDLLLNHPNVSAVHAVIFERSGRRFVRDLNSTAGTFVNGRKVREAELHGDEDLRLGTAWLRYEKKAVEEAVLACDEVGAESVGGDELNVGLEGTGDLPPPGSIAATLEDLAAAEESSPAADDVEQDELTAAEGLMAVAAQEDALADLATPDDVFGDVPGDVFRLRRAEAGERGAAVPPAEARLPDAKPQAAAPVERYNDYTYETGPAAAPVGAVPAVPAISTSTWVSRKWLGVRRVCRSLLGRTRSTPPPTHATTSRGCKSQEVPTC